jgi:hypothetical protein
VGQFDDIIGDMINEDDFMDAAPPGDAAQSDPTESFGEPGTHGGGSGSDSDPYGGRAPVNEAGTYDPTTSPPADDAPPRNEEASGDDDEEASGDDEDASGDDEDASGDDGDDAPPSEPTA